MPGTSTNPNEKSKSNARNARNFHEPQPDLTQSNATTTQRAPKGKMKQARAQCQELPRTPTRPNAKQRNNNPKGAEGENEASTPAEYANPHSPSLAQNCTIFVVDWARVSKRIPHHRHRVCLTFLSCGKAHPSLWP